jgi:hypothetical protein
MRAASPVATVAIALVVSVVTSFAVGRWSASRTEPPPAAGATELKGALADVERGLVDIRQLLASWPITAPGDDPAPELRGAPSGAVPLTSRPPPPDEAPPGAKPAPSRETTAPLLPPADLSRAEEVHDWEEKEDVRRRWFLVSEAEALSVFGTPMLVTEWGAGERWEYSNEDWNLSLCFLRGRLVNAYSTDKRRR